MEGEYRSGNNFFIKNPWDTMVSDLPSKILSAMIGTEPIMDFFGMAIVWDLLDRDIAATGTMSTDAAGNYTGRLVRGYLHNRHAGQEVTLRLFVDRWTFASIREQRGTLCAPSCTVPDHNVCPPNWVLMSPVNFFFSRINERSQQSDYQVSFRVERILARPKEDQSLPHRNETETVTVSKDFVPEDIATSYDRYVLYWDNHARNNARNGGQHTGAIMLGNSRKTPLAVNNAAIYQYEAASVSQLNFGHGFGRAGLAIIAVCPLNPIIPATAIARGRINQDPDAHIGIVAITAVDAVSPQAFARFIGGGIRADFRVRVTIYDDFASPNRRVVFIQEEMRVRLVFLDRAFDPEPARTGFDEERRDQVFRTTFSPAFYAADGRVNPYGTADTAIFNALNAFAAVQPITQAHFLNIVFPPDPFLLPPGTIVGALSFTVQFRLGEEMISINYGGTGFNPIVNPMRIRIVS
jgi:hypothetical protein